MQRMTTSDSSRTESTITLNQLFTALSHSTRRRILLSLVAIESRDRAEYVPEKWGPDAEEHDQFELTLYHNHLPHLDEAGLVDWDPESDTIARGPRFEEILPALRLLDEHEDQLPGEWL